ncbi:MAG: hypothetical protein AAF762_05440 [Pseudomonadota bacterium]
MSGFESLLLYLAIGAVLVFIGSFKSMGRYRRGLNKLANRHVDNLGSAKVIAGLGDHKEVREFAGRRTFRLTIGIRALSTVLTGLLLILLSRDIGAENPLVAPEGHGITAFGVGVALGLYYLVYIWRYALVIQDHELHVPTYALGVRVYDLRKLEMMEDDGAYGFNLWFDGGGKAAILKYVEGRAALTTTLEHYRDANKARDLSGAVSA